MTDNRRLGNRTARYRVPDRGDIDARLRRAAGSQATGSDLGHGLTLRDGKITLATNSRSPLFINANGELDIRLGNGMSVDYGDSTMPKSASSTVGGGPALMAASGETTVNTSLVIGGGSGGGGGTTVVNNFLDDHLVWLGW